MKFRFARRVLNRPPLPTPEGITLHEPLLQSAVVADLAAAKAIWRAYRCKRLCINKNGGLFALSASRLIACVQNVIRSTGFSKSGSD